MDSPAHWETYNNVTECNSYPLQYCGLIWCKNADW